MTRQTRNQSQPPPPRPTFADPGAISLGKALLVEVGGNPRAVFEKLDRLTTGAPVLRPGIASNDDVRYAQPSQPYLMSLERAAHVVHTEVVGALATRVRISPNLAATLEGLSQACRSARETEQAKEAEARLEAGAARDQRNASPEVAGTPRPQPQREPGGLAGFVRKLVDEVRIDWMILDGGDQQPWEVSYNLEGQHIRSAEIGAAAARIHEDLDLHCRDLSEQLPRLRALLQAPPAPAGLAGFRADVLADDDYLDVIESSDLSGLLMPENLRSDALPAAVHESFWRGGVAGFTAALNEYVAAEAERRVFGRPLIEIEALRDPHERLDQVRILEAHDADSLAKPETSHVFELVERTDDGMLAAAWASFRGRHAGDLSRSNVLGYLRIDDRSPLPQSLERLASLEICPFVLPSLADEFHRDRRARAQKAKGQKPLAARPRAARVVATSSPEPTQATGTQPTDTPHEEAA